MDLNDVAVFVKVVQAGSFTGAARALGAPKSTVSAKVASLERQLGVTLLQRTTRKLSVTPEGDVFFRSCATALGEIEAAESSVTSKQKSPQGRITVTAPIDLGSQFMPTFLNGFLAKYPDIDIGLSLSNRFVDLVGEGIDVGVRAGDLKDSSLVAKRLGSVYRGLFASPAYVKRAGVPTDPKSLSEHKCILFGSFANDVWTLVRGGKSQSVKVKGRVVADDMTSIKEFAVQGHGIALLPTFSCHGHVQKKQLVPLLPEWRTEPNAFSIVYPSQKFQHARVRVFIDELAKALGETFDLGQP